MRLRTVALAIVVIIAVTLTLAILYPYVSFKPPEPVSANWRYFEPKHLD